jgi:hypothetical protein
MSMMDIFNAHEHNRMVDARLEAKVQKEFLDHARKIGLYGSTVSYGNIPVPSNEDNATLSTILSKLTDIDNRISRLEKAISMKQSPFCVVEDGCMISKNTVQLTDAQFKVFLNSIMR